MATIPSCAMPWFMPRKQRCGVIRRYKTLWDTRTVPAGLKQTLPPFDLSFPPLALQVTARSCLLNKPISTNVVPVGDNHMLLHGWLLLRCPTATQFWVGVTAAPPHKRRTYPMNHAPLLARVPFCFQARK